MNCVNIRKQSATIKKKIYEYTYACRKHGPLMSSKLFGQKFVKLWAIIWWLATRSNSTLCWKGLELTFTSRYNIIFTCSVLWILDEETNYLYGITHALKRFQVPQPVRMFPKDSLLYVGITKSAINSVLDQLLSVHLGTLLPTIQLSVILLLLTVAAHNPLLWHFTYKLL